MSEEAATLSKSKLIVPRLLYGPSQGEAHRKWRRVARKAAKNGSWEEALREVEFMPIEEVSGDFSCYGSRGQLFEGDNLWLDDLFEILFNATADAVHGSSDPDAWAKLLEHLTISGLDQFWFALGLSVTTTSIIMWRNPEEKRRVAIICLAKMLYWWPTICPYDQRFTLGQKTRGMFSGWPSWGGGLTHLCEHVGKHQSLTGLTKTTAIQAGEKAREWLNKSLL